MLLIFAISDYYEQSFMQFRINYRAMFIKNIQRFFLLLILALKTRLNYSLRMERW